MELRKLEPGEHRNTRELWETVFSEDSKEFLDYYYYFKTKDNEIFVIEEDGGIRSMLMLHSAHSLSNILRMPACLSISWRNIVR